MLLNWTPDYSLEMNARRFFAIIRSARDIDFKKTSRNLYNLCYVAQCGKADTKWIEEVMGHYRSGYVTDEPYVPASQVSSEDLGQHFNKFFGGVA